MTNTDTTAGALERVPSQAPTLAERERRALRRDCEMYAKSGVVPERFRGKPDAIEAVALSIRATNMPVTLVTLNQWWVDPKGVARPQVQFIIGVGAARGVELWVDDDQCTDTQAVAYGRRAGQDVRKCTYTIERAKKANLTNKDNWKSHTPVMLKWRALGELVRTNYPDVALGLPSGFLTGDFGVDLTREELQAAAVEVDLDAHDGDEPEDAEVVEPCPLSGCGEMGDHEHQPWQAVVADMDKPTVVEHLASRGLPTNGRLHDLHKRLSDAIAADQADKSNDATNADADEDCGLPMCDIDQPHKHDATVLRRARERLEREAREEYTPEQMKAFD